MKRFLLLLAMSAIAFVSCSGGKKIYKVDVVREYPHDVNAYTQGLFFENGDLYESTGLYGNSDFRKVDIESGAASKIFDLDDEYFGEGSVIFGSKLYLLTWESNRAFVYDPVTWQLVSAWKYPREGWGLTTDGKNLIASDGSSKLYFMDENYKLVRKINVTDDGKPVRWLNELEWIDGKIWANVYTTDYIVIINPKSGKVEAKIDCTGLLPDQLKTKFTDVLNGIAYDKKSGRIFLTGKKWPRMYEIKLKK